MIPVFKPYLNELEKVASAEVLEVGWLGMGKYVGDFEEKVSKYIGITDRHVVALSTGHAAIHLALILMGVGDGDEVITPSFNNVSDFQAILACGAKPVFCDVDERTLCIDLKSAEKLVNEKTKAIIVMDYDCLLCDHDAIADFAAKYKLRVLHDAAHSFGSKYKGKMVGSFSDITMFSFDPVKTITCLDGGVLVVKSEEERNKLHEMRLVGMTQPSSTMYQNKRAWTYDVQKLGFRYHMSNMHAAIGLAQLSKMGDIETTRRQACVYYNQNLSKIPGVRVPDTDFKDVVPFLYYVRVNRELRDGLRKFMFENKIDNGIHWQPGHWFSLFKNCRAADLSITDKISDEIISLPLHSGMSQEDQRHIVQTIKTFMDQAS